MNSVKKMVNIGERLKYIRETYDISGKELASILGIEKSSISHYEKNDRTIPIEHLIKFSDHLKLSIDYIFGLTDIKNYEDHVEGVEINKMAENIKIICEEQHLTNVALAKIIGSCESNIRNYKNGKYLILTSFALQIATSLNYSIDWMLGKTTQKQIMQKKHLSTTHYVMK